MNLQEQILLMRANLDSAEEHIKSLEAGRKSSSSKARSSLMKLKTQSHTLRRDVILKQKELPTKKRTKKTVVEPVEPVVSEPVIEPTVPETPIKKTRKPRSKKAANTE